MRQVLAVFEASIKERPHEWLWIHNRWKQQQPGKIYKKFRHDAIAFIFPDNATAHSLDCSDPVSLSPRANHSVCSFCLYSPEIEVKTYDELFARDYRFKLLVDFTQNIEAQKHFSRS